MRKKARIIALANQKGGVGKTTTCFALAYGLSDKGNKVLLIDTDPQLNLTGTFGINEDYGEKTIYQIFKKQLYTEDCITRYNENLDIISGSMAMAEADMEFNITGREYILKKALEAVAEKYDYILIDTPPTLGIITINALTAADSVIIPMKAAKYSVQGLSQILHTLDTVKEYTNSNLKIEGILITQHDERTNIRRNIKNALESILGKKEIYMFNTTIGYGVAVEEAEYEEKNLFDKKSEATVINDYRTFVEEFLAKQEA